MPQRMQTMFSKCSSWPQFWQVKIRMSVLVVPPARRRQAPNGAAASGLRAGCRRSWMKRTLTSTFGLGSNG